MMSYTTNILNNYIALSGATIKGELPALKKEARICFICKCGTEYSKSFVRLKISGMFCEKCTNNSKSEKCAQTNLEKYGNTCSLQAESIKLKSEKTLLDKYGTTTVFKHPDILEKIKQTNIEKYGCANPFASKACIQKIRNTNIEKYGVPHPTQNDEIKAKKIKTNMAKYGVPVSSKADIVKQKACETNLKLYGCTHHITEEIMEKIKKTNMEKYGKEYSFQVDSVKESIRTTMLERYGVEHNMKYPVFQEKAKQTNLARLNVPYALMSKDVREKSKQTSLLRYGVKYPNQSHIMQDKIFKTGIRFKEYTTPSGSILKVQGYEPHALDILFKSYTEEDILTSRLDVPRINYIDEDGKDHYYFPDIYVKSINKIIEVKSTWTYKQHVFINQLKWKASTGAGYSMEFWIFDSKKRLTVVNDPTSPV